MREQGWNYRRAYFEDADARYYEVTLSVSRNGDISEAYNVGRLQQRKNTASSRGSSVREDGARTAKIDSDNDVGVLDSSIAPDESLSNSLFDSLRPEQRTELLGSWAKQMVSDQGQQRAEKTVLCKGRPPGG